MGRHREAECGGRYASASQQGFFFPPKPQHWEIYNELAHCSTDQHSLLYLLGTMERNLLHSYGDASRQFDVIYMH